MVSPLFFLKVYKPARYAALKPAPYAALKPALPNALQPVFLTPPTWKISSPPPFALEWWYSSVPPVAGETGYHDVLGSIFCKISLKEHPLIICSKEQHGFQPRASRRRPVEPPRIFGVPAFTYRCPARAP